MAENAGEKGAIILGKVKDLRLRLPVSGFRENRKLCPDAVSMMINSREGSPAKLSFANRQPNSTLTATSNFE